MTVCYTATMNKSQNKNKAINIKVYGQTVRVLGGKVAGQYTGAFTTKKSTRKRPSAKQGINWKRVKLTLKVIIALIVFSWICSHLEYRPPVKPVPVVEAKEQEWQFPKEYRSADMPGRDVMDREKSNALEKLIQNESSGEPGRLNPNSYACGIGQAWPCTKMYPHATKEWINKNKFQKNGKWYIPTQGYDFELEWMKECIRARYGTPEKALKFWESQKPHWY